MPVVKNLIDNRAMDHIDKDILAVTDSGRPAPGLVGHIHPLTLVAFSLTSATSILTLSMVGHFVSPIFFGVDFCMRAQGISDSR